MRTISQLIGKFGLVAVGVGVGVVIAASGGVAAMQYSQLTSDHSISAQPAPSADDRGGLRTTGSDDVAGVSASPSGSSEPEPGDDSRSGVEPTAEPETTTTRGNGTADDGTHRESTQTPQPGDDHGRDGAR